MKTIGQDKAVNGISHYIRNTKIETCAWCGSLIPIGEGYMYRCNNVEGNMQCKEHNGYSGKHYMCVDHYACKKRVTYNAKMGIKCAVSNHEYKPVKRKNMNQMEMF